MTRLAVALKPVLNRARHRWLAKRLRFRPFRSWKRWLLNLLLTFCSLIMRWSMRKAAAGDGADVGVVRSRRKMVRPVTAWVRIWGRSEAELASSSCAKAKDLLAMMEAMSTCLVAE